MTTALTATFLHDLLDGAALDRALSEGYVRRQYHPGEPLAILNYTEKTAYENAWDDVTRACRGLVYRTDTGQVVARPFEKFMNHGQAGAAPLALDAPVQVTDKLDGSLGVLHPLPSGGWAVATRGSFASDQAVHATHVLASRYPGFEPPAGVTVLVEILYPGNRIVVDYGATDDLHLLGAVEIATGAVLAPGDVPGWPGPVTATFAAPTFADALALAPRPNAEGVVVRCLRTGAMVKIKQADYVALHRIVTGLTARAVWQHLVEGTPLDALIEPLPDEFHAWVLEVAGSIAATVDAEEHRLRADYATIRAQLGDGWQRRDFAAAVATHPQRWAMFQLLDDRDITTELLKRARPEADWTPSGVARGEDTA